MFNKFFKFLSTSRKTFLEFFQTDSNKSMTRLIFFIDIVSCVTIAIIAICLNRDLTATAGLVGSLLGPVSVVKFIQSKYEEENSIK